MKFVPQAVAACLLQLALLAPGRALDVARRAAAGQAALSAAEPQTAVTRVVTLLTDLKGRLKEDEVSQRATFEKYVCWCEATIDRKAAAITTAVQDIRGLGQEALKFTAEAAIRTSEIAKLKKDLAANEEKQKETLNMQQKILAGFMERSEEQKQALAALWKAIRVLREGSTASLVQHGASGGADATEQARRQRQAVRAAVGALPQSRRVGQPMVALLREYLGGGTTGNAALRAGSKYAPQSDAVTGTLTGLYASYAQDLQDDTAEVMAQSHDMDRLLAVQREAHGEMSTTLPLKVSEKASAEKMLVTKSKMLEEATTQKQNDIELFDQTKVACEGKHGEFTSRKALRDLEISGIAKAIVILEGNKTFLEKTVGKDASPEQGATSFLQKPLAHHKRSAAAVRAFAALRKAAGSGTHRFRLASLAVRTRTAKVGHFDEVLKSIDALMGDLRAEQVTDAKNRDFCQAQYQQHLVDSEALGWEIKKDGNQITALASDIEVADAQFDAKGEAISDIVKEAAGALSAREAENTAYLKAVEDNKKAAVVLEEARAALASYYDQHVADPGPLQLHVRRQEPESKFERSPDQAPEANIADKGSRQLETKGITSFLAQLIEDLHAENKNLAVADEQAQLEYAGFVKSWADQQTELGIQQTTLEEYKADLGTKKSTKQEDKSEKEAELKAVGDVKNGIQGACDKTIENFEKRAKARGAEIDGLRDAKEYLAGAQNNDDGSV